MTPDKIFLKVNGKRVSLAKLIAKPAAATYVRVDNCPGLTALPELPAATDVRVYNCPGLTALNAGSDHRGYQFVAVQIREQWRIIAGCRNYSLEDARAHWRTNAECAALVEKLAAEIASRVA